MPSSKLPPVKNYLKSVTTSLVFTARDVVAKDLVPDVASFHDTNKEFIKATFTNTKIPPVKDRKIISAFQNNRVFQTIDYGFKNIMSDLKSGDFYAKTREDQDLADLAGFDFGDFDDLSEFGIDADWEKNLDNDTSTANVISKGEAKIVESVEKSSAAQAQATVMAVISGADKSIKASRANTALLFQQQEKIFSSMHQDLSVIGATLTSVFNLTSKVLTNIDNNISEYQTQVLKIENERTAILKEMLEIQRNQYKSAQQKEMESARNRSSKKKRFSDVSIGGVLDLEEYVGNIKSNIIEEFLGGDAQFLDNLKMAMVTPMRDLTAEVFKALIPQTIKAATEDLNKVTGSLFANIIANLSSKRNEGGAMGALAKILGVNTSVNRKLETGNYEKGPVPWDGLARRAIMNVIPGYLARIEAYLTGEERIYNYDSGKFVSSKSIGTDFNRIKKNSVMNATYDVLNSGFNASLEANAPTRPSDRAEFNQAIDEFRQYLYDNNGYFRPRDSAIANNVNKTNYPMFFKHYKKIAKIYDEYDIVDKVDNNGRVVGKRHSKSGEKMDVARRVLQAKESEELQYRSLEAGGHSIYIQAAERGLNGTTNGVIKKNGNTTVSGPAAAILEFKDKHGYTIHNYLHNINKELIFWRVNYGDTGFGGVNNPSGKAIKKISRIDIDTKEAKREQRSIRREEAKRRSESNANSQYANYKKMTLEDIMSGRMVDLRSFRDYRSAEFGFHLNRMSRAEREKILKEQLGAGNYNAEIVESWLKENYSKANIGKVEDIQKAIDRANSSNKKTNEVLTKEEQGFLGKIIAKLGGGRNALQNIVNQPAEAFSNILLAADRTVYETFFIHTFKDKDGNEYDGFLDMLRGKTENLFDDLAKKLQESFKKHIWDKLKALSEKFGLDEKFNRYKTALGGIFRGAKDSARDTTEYFKDEIGAYRLREDMRKTGGDNFDKISGRQYFKSGLVKGFKSNKGAIKNYRDDMYRAEVKGGDTLNKRVASVGFDGDIDNKINILVNKYGVDPERIDKALKHAKTEEDKHEVLNKMFNRIDIKQHAKGTITSKPYTGLTMLSKGELLFNKSGVSMVKKTGAYNITTPTDIMTSKDSAKLLDGLGIKAGQSPKSVQRDQYLENLEKKKLFGSHAAGTFSTRNIFSNNKIFNEREFTSEEGKQFIKESKNYVPEMLAGATVGTGTSLLLGLVGGPLVGAAVGAGAMLLKNSEAMRKIIFGSMGSDGKRKNDGLIKTSIQDTVKKYAPDVTRFGTLGLVASLITPLGPVGGIMIGSALGILKQNEEMREKLFGRLKIGDKEKDIIRKMLPGALKGAGVGIVSTLFGGPFGLMGNAIVGSAIGMMASTDDFKDGLLGRKINGIRQGGVLGTVAEAFQPLKDAANDFRVRILESIDKNILEPLSDFVQPAIHAIPQLIAWLPRKLNDKLDEKFGWGFNHVIEKLFVNPAKKLLKPAEAVVGTVFNTITSPFRLVGAAGNAIRRRQMATGNADYMTAEERINWKKSHHMGDQQSLAGDEFFAGLSADKAQEMLDLVTSIDDNAKVLEREKNKQQKDIIAKINSYRTAEGYKVSTKAKDAIKKAINLDKLDQIPKILQTYKLDGTDHGMTAEQVKSFMQDSGLDKSITSFKSLASRHKRVSTLTADKRDKNKEKISAALEAAGISEFDLDKKSGRDKLSRYLQTEIDYKSSSEFEESNEELRAKFAEETNDNVKIITEILKSISEKGIEVRDLVNPEVRKEASGFAGDISKGLDAAEDLSEKYFAKNSEKIGADKVSELNEYSQSMLYAKADHHILGTAGTRVPYGAINAMADKNMSADIINAIGQEGGNYYGGYDTAFERAKKLSNIKTDTGVLKLAPIAAQYAATLTTKEFSMVYKVLSNVWVAASIKQAGRAISVRDIKDALSLHSVLGQLASKAEYVVQNKISKRFKSIKELYNAEGINATVDAEDNVYKYKGNKLVRGLRKAGNFILGRNVTYSDEIPDEDTDDGVQPQPEPDHNFLGTILGLGGKLLSGALGLGGKIIKNLFGGGEQAQEGDQSQTAGLLGNVMSAFGGAVKGAASSMGGAIGGDVDKQGDNSSVVQTEYGPAKVVQETDGSVEYDTSDNKTKDIINKITFKEKMQEKLWAAQEAASNAVTKALDVGRAAKSGAKKGMGWLSALLLGGMLLKSGILQKLWKNVLKPLWTEHVWPWIDGTVIPWFRDTAFPWIKNEILLPVWDFAKEKIINPLGDWFLNTALPKVGDWLGENLPGIISSALLGLGGAAGGLVSGVKGAIGSVADFFTGTNSSNRSTDTKINPSNKDGSVVTEMRDEKGNKLTYDDISNGNYNKIYNNEGKEGTVNEDGTVTFKSGYVPGTNWLKKTANTTLHAVTQGGVAGKAIGAMRGVTGFLAKHTHGLVLGTAAKAADATTKATTAPGKAVTGLAKSMQNRALTIIADRAADIGNEKAFDIAANALEKTAVAATEAATKDTDKSAKLITKLSGWLAKGIEKLSSLPLFQSKMAQAAVGLMKKPGELISGFLDHIQTTFDDIIVRGCEKFGVEISAQVASKLTIILAILQLAADFTIGCDQAENILGVEDPSVLETIVAGVVNAIGNLIIVPAIFPGIPQTCQLIYKFFGNKLEERQKEAKETYEKYVEETGSTWSFESFMKRKHSFTGKVGGFVGDAAYAVGSGITTGAKAVGNTVMHPIKSVKGAWNFVTGGSSEEEDKKAEKQIANIKKSKWQYTKNMTDEQVIKTYENYKGNSLNLLLKRAEDQRQSGGGFELELVERYNKIKGIDNNAKGTIEFGIDLSSEMSALSPILSMLALNPVGMVGNGLRMGTRAINSSKRGKDTIAKVFKSAKSTIPNLIKGADDATLTAKDLINSVKTKVRDISSVSPMELAGNVSTGIGAISTGAVGIIHSGLATIKNYIVETITALSTIKTKETDETIKDAKDGRVSVFSPEYWRVGLSNTAGLGGTIQTIYNGLVRLVNAPALIISSLLGQMAGFFMSPISVLSKQMNNGYKATSNYINQDGINLATGSNGSTSIAAAGGRSGVATRVLATSGGTKTNSGGNVVSNFFSGVKNTASNVVSGIGNFFSGAVNGIKNFFGFGRGKYSKQNDPKIANIRYNSGTDSEYQTIGDSGCGPAAAVNVLESMYGRGLGNIVSASNFALRHGYKETNGGTKPGFFGDYFARNGVASQTTYNRNQIEKQIRSGHPTVLMGRDPRGVSNSTPYGKVPHYVSVTGTIGGKYAVVQDPESRYDDQIYSIKDLARKSQIGVTAMGSFGRGKAIPGLFPKGRKYGAGKYGLGKYGRGKSKLILVGDSKTCGIYDAIYNSSAEQYIGKEDSAGNYWVCKVGMGLSWMKSTAEPLVNSKVNSDYAVVILMGVNDFTDSNTSISSRYVEYINAKAKEWVAKGAEVWFVAVPPIDGEEYSSGSKLSNEGIKKFNSEVSSGLSSDVKYLDIYSPLEGNVKCASDHLHYKNETYKKVWELVTAGIASGQSSTASSSTSPVAGDATTAGTVAAAPVDNRNMLLFEAHYRINGNRQSGIAAGYPSSASYMPTDSGAVADGSTNAGTNNGQQSIIQNIGNKISDAAKNLLSNSSNNKKTNTKSNNLLSGAKNAANIVANKAKNAANSVYTGAKNAANTVYTGAKNFANNVVDKAKNAANTAVKGAKNVTTGISNFFSGAVNNVKNLFGSGKGKYGRGNNNKAEQMSLGEFLANSTASAYMASMLSAMPSSMPAQQQAAQTQTVAPTAGYTASSAGDATSTPSTMVSVGGKFKGKQYNLNDTQITQIANAMQQEQSGDAGIASEVSLAANLLETRSNYQSTYGNDFVRFMQNAKWFASVTRRAATNTSKSNLESQSYHDVVKDVLVNGNRVFPLGIDEHDCFSDISYATNNGDSISVRDRSSYKPGVTKIHNRYGSNYTFYAWADPSKNSGDPFGYTKSPDGSGGNGIKLRSRFGMFGRGKFGQRATDNDYTKQVWAYLTTKGGFTPEAAAGMLGNIEHESGGNPYSVENWDDRNKEQEYTKKIDSGEITEDKFAAGGPGYDGAGPGYGLVQWTWHKLKRALYKRAKSTGKSIGSLDVQLDEIIADLKQENVYDKISKMTSAEDAATSILNDYEKPSERVENNKNRRKSASEFYSLYKDSKYTYTGSASDASNNNTTSTTTDATTDAATTGGTAAAGNGSDGLSSVGQFFANVLANSPAAQVLNSFLDMGGSTGSANTATDAASAGTASTSLSGGNIPGVITGSGDFPKYQLNDAQIKGVANIVANEQGDVPGWYAEASQMANLTDIDGKPHTAADVQRKATSGWYYHGSDRFYNPGNPSQTVINIVKDVFMNGHRTMPRYVNEHDDLGDIGSISTGSKRNRSDYKPHETIITQNSNISGGGGKWIFYGFPSSSGGDPFGYTSRADREKYGDACYTFDSSGSVSSTPANTSSATATTGQGKYDYGQNLSQMQREKLIRDRNKIRAENFNKQAREMLRQKRHEETSTGDKGVRGYGRGFFGQGNRSSEVWNWFTTHGYSDTATAAILGNMEQESGVDPEKIQGNGKGPAAGIVQWENYNTKSSRWKNMADYAQSKGRDWKDLESQLEFIDKENSEGNDVFWSKGSLYKSYDAFKKATDIKGATDSFELAFERADNPMMDVRYSAAQKYYTQFNGTGGTPISAYVNANATDAAQTTGATQVGGAAPTGNGSDGLSSVGQFLANVLANSPAAQVLNSFLDMGGSTGSANIANSANSYNSSGATSSGSSNMSGASYGPTGSGLAIVNAAKHEVELTDGTNKENPMGSNITKYGQFTGMNGEAWCQSFVGYCANKAGIPDDVLPNKEASTQDAYRVIIKKGQALSATDARPSDIIYFTNGGAGSIYHVGIVEDVSNGEIHTIEGNTSDMVRRKTYGPSRFGKIMIARPAYPDTGTTAATVPSTSSNVTFAKDTGIASYSNTRGGNGIKPISRFGQFKDNIYGEGNNAPRNLGRFSGSQKVKLESEEGVATVEYSNLDKAIGKYLSGGYRVPTPTPPKYGKGGNISNDSPSLDNTLIKQIIQILLTVANNTDKLNTIVTILQEKLNINITSKDVADAQTGSSASENLARALMQTNNASSKLNTYADTVGDASINSIIQAMNAIAAE